MKARENISLHSVRETVRKEPLAQVKLAQFFFDAKRESTQTMDFEEIPKPPEHVVRYAMGLVSGPCIAMIILGFAVRVSDRRDSVSKERRSAR